MLHRASAETAAMLRPAIALPLASLCVSPSPEEKTRSRSREARFAAFPKFRGELEGGEAPLDLEGSA